MFLLALWIFNLPHHIGMVRKELALDDAIIYAQLENGWYHS